SDTAFRLAPLPAREERSSGRVSIEQLDVNILRSAEKGDPHSGPDRLRLYRKLGAFLFELSDDLVDPVDPQADVLEAEVRGLRWSGHRLLWRDLRDEDGHSAEIEVEPRSAIRLHRANDLGAEHA